MADDNEDDDRSDIIKDAIDRAYWGGVLGGEKHYERTLSELRTLRAEAEKVQRLINVENALEIACGRLLRYQFEAEAWRKMRSVYLDKKYCADARMENLWSEMRRQIDRLGRMKEEKNE